MFEQPAGQVARVLIAMFFYGSVDEVEKQSSRQRSGEAAERATLTSICSEHPSSDFTILALKCQPWRVSRERASPRNILHDYFFWPQTVEHVLIKIPSTDFPESQPNLGLTVLNDAFLFR